MSHQTEKYNFEIVSYLTVPYMYISAGENDQRVIDSKIKMSFFRKRKFSLGG